MCLFQVDSIVENINRADIFIMEDDKYNYQNLTHFPIFLRQQLVISQLCVKLAGDLMHSPSLFSANVQTADSFVYPAGLRRDVKRFSKRRKLGFNSLTLQIFSRMVYTCRCFLYFLNETQKNIVSWFMLFVLILSHVLLEVLHVIICIFTTQ